MKKVYIAPDVCSSKNGTLEGVFAASTCGTIYSLRDNVSGRKATMSGRCKTATGFNIGVEINNNYGIDGIDDFLDEE